MARRMRGAMGPVPDKRRRPDSTPRKRRRPSDSGSELTLQDASSPEESDAIAGQSLARSPNSSDESEIASDASSEDLPIVRFARKSHTAQTPPRRHTGPTETAPRRKRLRLQSASKKKKGPDSLGTGFLDASEGELWDGFDSDERVKPSASEIAQGRWELPPIGRFVSYSADDEGGLSEELDDEDAAPVGTPLSTPSRRSSANSRQGRTRIRVRIGEILLQKSLQIEGHVRDLCPGSTMKSAATRVSKWQPFPVAKPAAQRRSSCLVKVDCKGSDSALQVIDTATTKKGLRAEDVIDLVDSDDEVQVDESRHRSKSQEASNDVVVLDCKPESADVAEVVVGASSQASRAVKQIVKQDLSDGEDFAIVRNENEVVLPHVRAHCPTALSRSLKGDVPPSFFCKSCFCLICDVKASLCENWEWHCHATDTGPLRRYWQRLRKQAKGCNKVYRAASDCGVACRFVHFLAEDGSRFHVPGDIATVEFIYWHMEAVCKKKDLDSCTSKDEKVLRRNYVSLLSAMKKQRGKDKGAKSAAPARRAHGGKSDVLSSSAIRAALVSLQSEYAKLKSADSDVAIVGSIRHRPSGAMTMRASRQTTNPTRVVNPAGVNRAAHNWRPRQQGRPWAQRDPNVFQSTAPSSAAKEDIAEPIGGPLPAWEFLDIGADTPLPYEVRTVPRALFRLQASIEYPTLGTRNEQNPPGDMFLPRPVGSVVPRAGLLPGAQVFGGPHLLPMGVPNQRFAPATMPLPQLQQFQAPGAQHLWPEALRPSSGQQPHIIPQHRPVPGSNTLGGNGLVTSMMPLAFPPNSVMNASPGRAASLRHLRVRRNHPNARNLPSAAENPSFEEMCERVSSTLGSGRQSSS